VSRLRTSTYFAWRFIKYVSGAYVKTQKNEEAGGIMLKTRHFEGAMAVLAMLFFVSASIVAAQSLDGKWFVMNCQVHAYAVDSTSGNFVICNFPF
jgi:hypothetical protein